MGDLTFQRYFDHTILRADATLHDIEQLCREAREHHFFSVCVNPLWLDHCSVALKGSDVAVCTVVNFPLGAGGISSTVTETQSALAKGATEIDAVIPIGSLKSGDDKFVGQFLRELRGCTQDKALLKIIVESGLLSTDELKRAIHLVNESGAEFIKTSTGFSPVGATSEAVLLMRELGRPGLKIKASGGIRTLEDAEKYIALGVHRIGASKTVEILKSYRTKS